MAGKGGGAWKVAYADFTTAMMAFFLVMWITSQNQDIRQAVAEHFNNPFGKFASGGGLRPPRRPAEFDPAQSRVKPDPLSDPNHNSNKPFRITVYQGDRTLIGTAVLFHGESSDLDAAAQQELLKFVPKVAGKPQKIEIRGHAARRPAAAAAPDDAWRLSYARCLKTLAFLRQHGIKPERMRLSQAATYEAQHPEIDARVEVFLLSEIVPDLRGESAVTIAHHEETEME